MTDSIATAALLAKAETLTDALPYLQRYAGKTFVVKYGGHAMGDPELARDFAEAGVALLGVSKDPPAKHRAFMAKQELAVPLATDAQDGGGLSDALGIWTEKQLYGKKFIGMVRTTYLLDADGRIARVWDKVKVKDHAAEVLEAAKAL